MKKVEKLIKERCDIPVESIEVSTVRKPELDYGVKAIYVEAIVNFKINILANGKSKKDFSNDNFIKKIVDTISEQYKRKTQNANTVNVSISPMPFLD